MKAGASKKKRRWQVHPGRNRFFCDGRFIASKNIGTLPLTIGLLVVTLALFYAFDAPYLWGNNDWGIVVVAVILTLICVTCLFLTSFGDPGIIARATSAERVAMDRFISASGIYVPEKRLMVAPPLTSIEDGQVVLVKFCTTCRIYRPVKCSHCSVCDNCVDHFDHHCPWLGNCVGRRNYATFFLFITSLSLLVMLLMTCEVVRIIHEVDDYGTFILQNPFSTVVLFVVSITSLPIVSLTAYHTYLLCVGASTWADLKVLCDPNPLEAPHYLKIDLSLRRCWKNWVDVFYEPLPAGINFRAYVTDEDTGKVER
uniref:Palmitoyltransferase n=1 Tax=Trichuris muris TaxID=70415 RepID=A0A5S6QZ73_TRIMR